VRPNNFDGSDEIEKEMCVVGHAPQQYAVEQLIFIHLSSMCIYLFTFYLCDCTNSVMSLC
jgi:hypothetical protein